MYHAYISEILRFVQDDKMKANYISTHLLFLYISPEKSELKFLQLHFSQTLDFRNQCCEMSRLFVCAQAFSVFPRFTNHQHIRTGCALKQIISYATVVFQRSGNKFFCGFNTAA